MSGTSKSTDVAENADDRGTCTSETARQWTRRECSENPANASHREQQTDHAGRCMHLTYEEDHFDRSSDAAEEVRGRSRGGNGAQQGVAEDEPKPLGDVVSQLGVPGLGNLELWLRSTDRRNGAGGDEKADRIDQDRGGAAYGLDQAAGNARPRDRGDLRAARELCVPLDQVFAPDERRQIRLVGDVEEHGEDAAHQSDDEELRQRQPPGYIGDGHGTDGDDPPQVGGDHDPAAAGAVYPDTGGQPHDEERGSGSRRQQAHLERRCMQRAHREERDREQTHLRSELADRLAAPEQAEVAMSEQDTPGHWGTLTRRLRRIGSPMKRRPR